MNELDLRGLACPEPVIRTKKYLAALPKGQVKVLVDNAAAFMNVQKLAKSLNCEAVGEEGNGVYSIVISKGEAKESLAEAGNQCVVLIASETFGTGDVKLGKKLMQSFLYTLTEKAEPPEKILLLNGGVKNAVQGADCLKNLQILSEKGTEILVCGTCLDFYNLKEMLAVGRISNMYEIEEEMSKSAKLISLT
ncbi:MAG: sulfurtransferase-like selenium metabolism protein YedF [bacterium]